MELGPQLRVTQDLAGEEAPQPPPVLRAGGLQASAEAQVARKFPPGRVRREHVASLAGGLLVHRAFDDEESLTLGQVRQVDLQLLVRSLALRAEAGVPLVAVLLEAGGEGGRAELASVAANGDRLGQDGAQAAAAPLAARGEREQTDERNP